MSCRQSRVSLAETRGCDELQQTIASMPDRDTRIKIWICKRALVASTATVMTAVTDESVADCDITAELDKITQFIQFYGQQ